MASTPLPSSPPSSQWGITDGNDTPMHGADDLQGSQEPSSFGRLGSSVSDDHENTLEMIQQLEDRVELGLQLMTSLENALSRFPKDFVQVWQEDIGHVRDAAKRSPVVIGVMGTTGAGKSSLINAVLGEKNLVPTSGMRACTSVATEISFNYDPAHRYKAEIEFRTKEEWTVDLTNLYNDLVDETASPNSPQSKQSNAFEKINAVYQIRNSDIKKHTVEELLGNEEVAALLGTTVTITENDPNRFYRQVHAYIESTTRLRSMPGSVQSSGIQIGQLWPLIRVVRIYTAADVLSSGLTIVDLPGSQDANAARCIIAKEYQEKCAAIWVVTPITRAVDDKVAQTLLGDGFTMQLKADGDVENVTFICTKTDDIGLEETFRTLIDDGISYDPDGKAFFEKFRADMVAVEERLDVIEDEYKELLVDKDELAARNAHARDRYSKVEMVLASREPAITSGHKRRLSPDLATGESQEHDQEVIRLSTMSTEELRNELNSASSRLKETFRYMRNTNEALEKLSVERQDLQQQALLLQQEPNRTCVIARNNFSKPRIAQDFAERIRIHDSDEETIDSEPRRNYDKLRGNVKVFCVSSRAYHQLNAGKRSFFDTPVKGYVDVYDTEIPQLKQHCLEFAAGRRRMACETFLNRMAGLLNSLEIRAPASTKTGEDMSEEKKLADRRFLKEQHEKLHKDLDDIVSETFRQLGVLAKEYLFDNLGRGAEHAQTTADATVQQWNSEKEGIAWNTYRAICRRSGVYDSPRGTYVTYYDWNEELSKPLLPAVAPGWEKFFQDCLPKLLEKHVRLSRRKIHDFHQAVDQKSQLPPAANNQLKTYTCALKDHANSAENEIKSSQRAINRKFSAYVQEALRETYFEAANTSGVGTYERMKHIMMIGVHAMRERAFDRVARGIESRIRDLLEASERNTHKRLARTLRNHRRDYASALRVQEDAQNAEFKAMLDEFLRGQSVVEFREYLAGLFVEAAPSEEFGERMEVDVEEEGGEK